jgi:hypothetical protein
MQKWRDAGISSVRATKLFSAVLKTVSVETAGKRIMLEYCHPVRQM